MKIWLNILGLSRLEDYDIIKSIIISLLVLVSIKFKVIILTSL